MCHRHRLLAGDRDAVTLDFCEQTRFKTGIPVAKESG